ncbi:MAG: general secretion pathway protein GspB [Desulfobacterales bacterium]|nr:general secretion pathway protein GspB [Desulfobacterales bacterium]
MSNREKIIVGLMLLTVAYGIYALFFEGKGKSSTTPTAVSATKQLENLNAFITKVAEASRAGLSKEDKYIISRAESAWKQDPLTTVELTDRPEDEINRQKKQIIQTTGPQLNVSYTGFMQMGDKKFAIVDGLEYTAGDELVQGGFKVRSITPRQVVIVSTDRSKKKFIFLIEE